MPSLKFSSSVSSRERLFNYDFSLSSQTGSQAEQRATEAERQVSKLQSEVDRVEGTVGWASVGRWLTVG